MRAMIARFDPASNAPRPKTSIAYTPRVLHPQKLARIVLGSLLLAACEQPRATVAEPTHPPGSGPTPPSPNETAAPAPTAAIEPPAPTVPPPETRAAAERGARQLQEMEPSILSTRAERKCEADATCQWRFPLADPKGAPDDSPVGWLLVQEGSNETHYQPNDGTTLTHTISGYMEQRKLAVKIVDLALRSRDVQQICAETKAQGAPCIVFIDQPGQGTCGAKPDIEDACLWSVYVGADMGGHSSRIATLYVDPQTLVIVSASTLACPAMPLTGWRSKRRAEKSGKLDDACPGAKQRSGG